MRSSTRDLLFGVALAALALSALGAGGVAVALRDLSLAREQAAARAQESVAALVADTQAVLHREARLLARDPALVAGVAKGDWATVARGDSPRLAAVTLERVADFVSVVDVAGSVLLRVPALPPTPLPDLAAISASQPGLTVLNGHPYVVAAVPVVRPAARNAREARPAGFVIIARRLENVVPQAAELLPGPACCSSSMAVRSSRLSSVRRRRTGSERQWPGRSASTVDGISSSAPPARLPCQGRGGSGCSSPTTAKAAGALSWGG